MYGILSIALFIMGVIIASKGGIEYQYFIIGLFISSGLFALADSIGDLKKHG